MMVLFNIQKVIISLIVWRYSAAKTLIKFSGISSSSRVQSEVNKTKVVNKIPKVCYPDSCTVAIKQVNFPNFLGTNEFKNAFSPKWSTHYMSTYDYNMVTVNSPFFLIKIQSTFLRVFCWKSPSWWYSQMTGSYIIQKQSKPKKSYQSNFARLIRFDRAKFDWYDFFEQIKLKNQSEIILLRKISIPVISLH